MPDEFQYSFDPSYSDLDMVRSLIGDTDENSPLLQDREIAAHIAAIPGRSLYYAAARCCRAIAGKYARRVDVQSDDIRKSNSQARKAYMEMAEEYDQQAAFDPTLPYAGGISKGDKDAQEGDTDRVRPSFTRKTGTPSNNTIGIANMDPRFFWPNDSNNQ